MNIVLYITIVCVFTLSYAVQVLPVSYAWSTFVGPVSGEVQEVKPNGESDGPNYVAKPDYSFSYGVDNPNTGDSHGHSETRDGSTVTGEYTVMEPDGVLRRVQYTADPKNGFRASVRFVRPDGESSSHEHGYHGGKHNHSDDGQDDGGGQDHGDDGHDHGDGQNYGGGHGRPSYIPSPPSQLSDYESDDNGPYAHPPPPPPPPPSSTFRFDFDGFNNNIINDNIGDDEGDYETDSGSPFFKFPSSSSSIYKTTETDSGDYGSDKYYDRDASGSHPPPPAHLGLPSSPSPFYSIARRSSSTAQPCAQPSAERSSLGRRSLSRQQRPSNMDRYQMSHSKGFSEPAAADEHPEPLPDSDGDSDSDSDHDDIVNYESDDSDFGTVDGDAVQLQPSTKSIQLLTSLSTSKTPTPRPPPPVTGTSTRAPFVRPTRRPSPSVVINLSPTPTMTAIEPIVIDI